MGDRGSNNLFDKSEIASEGICFTSPGFFPLLFPVIRWLVSKLEALPGGTGSPSVSARPQFAGAHIPTRPSLSYTCKFGSVPVYLKHVLDIMTSLFFFINVPRTLSIKSNKLKLKCILLAFVNTEPMNTNYDLVAQW